MNTMLVNGKRPLDCALAAGETMMRKFAPENLPPAGRFHYHQGVFLSGMLETYKLTGERKLFNYVKAWVDSLIDDYGNIVHFDPGMLDDLQPAILLFPLYEETKDARYKDAMDTAVWYYEHFPRNRYGGFWHKAVHRDEMWLDGLYMAGPFMAQYAKEFNQPALAGLAVHQAELMERFTRDDATGLWYHAVDLRKCHPWADPKTGCSPEFWGRAMGWVPVALLNEMDFLPNAGKAKLARITHDLLFALINFQDDATGLWYQVVNKGSQPGNWLETSCSCLYTAGICKAVRTGVLPESALEPAKKAVTGVINRLVRSGDDVLIENICEGTGVGNYAFYCNRKRCVNDLHGVGAFLLMCAEAERVFNEK